MAHNNVIFLKAQFLLDNNVVSVWMEGQNKCIWIGVAVALDWAVNIKS